ncbi:MAG: primosomal protein N' [Kiritimatiellae bacterium]|nr:primosomal protein N' [Kiritimatiellia bacterium]
MVAKVAIDLGLDRLFAYEAPEGLKKKLAVGQLLLVPFGHRNARGFVMELSDAAPEAKEGYSLKQIHSILDETPFFSPALLKLVRRIAEYTAAPIESVLRAAVPAAVVKQEVRPRELLFVEPALAPCAMELTKRQRWLYDQVVRLGGGWMRQLCDELKTTPSSLRALGQKGLLTVAARQRRRDPLAGRRVLPSKPLPLNGEQSAALAKIAGLGSGGSGPSTLLLHGVTGSGKTEVYLQAIAAELAAGRGAIVMVPEIALTPQTVQRFASRFGDRVAVLHSALSEGERYDEWHRIRSGEARVVVGPRSAVFAPVRGLGLVVVDEEHETSYKQEDNPRYNARDVAVMRGAIEGAKVVLGSATPSLETWANVAKGKYAVATMSSRAGAGKLPYVNIVDMGEERGGRDASDGPRGAIFSARLLDAVKTRLERGEQTILFLNRRGYSRSVTCAACGYVAECPECSLPYTYHRADDCCRCHVCGGWIPTPKACPSCGSPSLDYRGIGTQRAELALSKCFPSARILRMDADSTSRKNSHDDILGAFRRHEADILIGTQMIAKGLDFPNVTLVGVLNADSSLNMPDFRAGERTYQLLSQVAGRAGRAELPGEVFIQTYDPSSSVIRAAARGDYAAFAAEELSVRRGLGFPPYCHLSVIGLRSRDLKLVGSWAEMYATSLARVKGLDVGDAVPCALEKADGLYRWQIVVRAQSVALTVKSWRWLLSVRPPPSALIAYIDIDAFGMM